VKVAINIEFTDEELVKHAEDVGRRVGLNLIRDAIRHLGVLKINPDLAASVAGAVAGVAAKARGAQPPASDLPSEPPPPSSTSLEKCVGMPSTEDMDEGRLRCHERCDVAPPSADDGERDVS